MSDPSFDQIDFGEGYVAGEAVGLTPHRLTCSWKVEPAEDLAPLFGNDVLEEAIRNTREELRKCLDRA